MAISEKLKPLTDSIYHTLVSARSASEPGTMSTKAIMIALGMEPNAPNTAKMRTALKALKCEAQVYRLGNTRATVYKAVLPSDDDLPTAAAVSDSNSDSDQGTESSILLSDPGNAPGDIPVIVLGESAASDDEDEDTEGGEECIAA